MIKLDQDGPTGIPINFKISQAGLLAEEARGRPR